MEASVDVELDRLISRRASEDRRPDPVELEPSYVASVRRYHAHRKAENEAEWLRYHRDQAERHRRVLASLVAFHEAQAARLCELVEGPPGEGGR